MKYATLVITTFVFFFSCALYGQQQTSDGGYIIAGTGSSYVHGADPNTDFLVYKLSASGVKQWRKNYGGDDYEYCSHVIQTSDGGYALCGQTRSYTHGQTDFLVYRLDPAGAKLWRKNYGGISFERPRRIVQTSDGGFVVSGYTDTYTNGGRDILVYRLNAAGTKLWRKNYGGVMQEYIYVWD
jgi:hypothetical protein